MHSGKTNILFWFLNYVLQIIIVFLWFFFKIKLRVINISNEMYKTPAGIKLDYTLSI